MLSVQKSPSNKSGLGFVESISVFSPHSTNFVPSSSSEPSVSETVKPPVSEIVKPLKVTPPRKIRVDLKESKPEQPTLSKDKSHDKPAWVCHFCGKVWTHTSKLLQAASCKESKQTKSTRASSIRSNGTHW